MKCDFVVKSEELWVLGEGLVPGALSLSHLMFVCIVVSVTFHSESAMQSNHPYLGGGRKKCSFPDIFIYIQINIGGMKA